MYININCIGRCEVNYCIFALNVLFLPLKFQHHIAPPLNNNKALCLYNQYLNMYIILKSK